MANEKQEWDLKKAIGHKWKPYEVQVTNKDIILYSLGIGFQQDPLNKSHYNFTYENAEEFQSFPTIAVVLSHRGSLENLTVPGMPQFNPMMLLHGEESLEVFKPIQADTTVVVQEQIIDLQDKNGKATAMIVQTEAKDKSSDQLLFKVTTNLFIRGIGGFGHKGTVKIAIPDTPTRQPDFVQEEKTTPNQAFLYRLNGDYNPLHVDPQMSEMGGFKVPILHGLCSLGITARSIYEKYHQQDPIVLKQITSRFTSHVFPGETLLVETWKEGNKILFNTKTKERGIAVMKGFYELREQAKM